MHATRFLLGLSLVLFAASACQCPVAMSEEPAPPTLSRVEPDRGGNDAPRPITIVGEGLLPRIYRDLSNPEGVSVDARFAARLGGTDLLDVAWVDEQHLRAVVPAGIAAGVYPLFVDTPLGLSGSLADAYTATAPGVLQISAVKPADLVNDATATLSVTGQGFGSDLGVRLQPASGAAVDLAAVDVQPGSFTAVVPAGLAPGSYALVVSSAEAGQAEAADVVAIWAPAALGLSAGVSQAVVSVGQAFSVTVHVSNSGGSSSIGVTAAVTVPEVAGLATLVSGPAPASADVDPGTVQDFVFAYTAAAPGSLHFTLLAQGVNAFSGRANTAPSTVSAALTVQQPAALAVGLGLDAAQRVLGESLTVTVTASNLGVAPAVHVVPVLTPDVAGPLTLSSGPSPAHATIPGQGRARFTYVLLAAAAGDVVFMAAAQGEDGNSGAAVAAPAVASSAVHVLASGASLVATLAVPASVSAGQSFNVVMSVHNSGAVAATGVAPSLEAPTGTGTVVRASGPAPASANLVAGARQAFTYTLTAQGAGEVGFAGAAAGVDSASRVAVTSARVVASPLQVQTAAALGASWSGLPGLLTQGQSFELTLSVSNSGQAAARAVVAGSALVVGSTGTSCSGPTPASASIAGGASQAYVYACTAGSSAGALGVEGAASGVDANSGAPVATGTVSSGASTVQAPPALGLRYQVPGTVVVGDSFNVVVVVTNAGEAGALGVAPLAPPAPSDASAITYLSGPLPVDADVAGGGGTASFTYVFQAARPTTLHLSTSAAGTDANSGNAVQVGPVDSGDLLVQPPADLRAALTAPSLVSTGQRFDVTMTVTNQGVIDVNGVQPSTLSVVPAGAAFVVTAPVPPWPDLTASGGSAQLTWTLQVVAASSAAFRVDGTASGTAAGSGGAVDSLPARSSDTLVQSAAALLATWSTPLQVTRGQAFEATLRATNVGQAAAQGVTAEVATVGGGTGTTCAASSPASQLIPGGAVRSFVYSCTAGSSSGDATLSAGAQGTDLNSGSSVSAAAALSDAVAVQSAPALTATWETVPAVVTCGQLFAATLTVDNSGEASAIAVTPDTAAVSGSTGTTCGPATPASLDLAGGASQVFTYACVAGGSAGSITLAAGASGEDANSGVAVSAAVATSGSMQAQGPRNFIPLWTVRSTVNRGQGFQATVRVTNIGSNAATGVAIQDFAVHGSTGTTCGTSSPASAGLAPGASQDYVFDCAAGALSGSAVLQASVVGTDAVSGTTVRSELAISSAVLVQVPAALQVVSVEASVATVVREQTGVLVSVQVANTGEAAAAVVADGSWLLFAAGATDVSSDYNVVASAGNPGSIAGGSSETFGFVVDVDAGATPGLIALDALAVGTDANDRTLLAASGATTIDTWTVTANTPPTACIRVDATVRDLDQVLTVSAACSSDAEDPLDALVVDWDWEGDAVYDAGPMAAAATATHAYSSVGVMRVGARVRDRLGDAGYTTFLIVVAPAAQTLVVTSTSAAGAGSLRGAIAAANQNTDLSTIRFDHSVFAGTPTTIALARTTLRITQPVQIVGHSGVRVQGNRTIFDATASGVTLAHLEVVGNTRGGANACITASGADLWLVSSSVLDCETGLLVSGNSAEIGPDNTFDGAELAIDVDGGTGHLIHDNRILACSDTACLRFGNGAGPSDVTGNLFAGASVPLIVVGNANGLNVLHNTLHGATGYGLDLRGTGHTVHNNIFTSNTRGAICDRGGSLNATRNDYNAVFGNGPSTGCVATAGAHQVTADPLYADAAGLDFTLQATSPCIDTGTATVVLDVTGAAPGLFEGLAPDVGAFERPQP